MEYTLNKDTLKVKDIIFEGCQEQPVDIDFTLPDYCPDIQRILKCQLYPQINTKNISSDRLDIDGNANVKLLYVDSSKSKVRCFQHSIPFSASFNLKEATIDAAAIVKTKVEYVNCRAVSSRRLDVHGAFSICAKVIGESDQEFLTDISSEDIQQKKIKTCASSIAGIGQQKFSISEVMEIGQGKSQAESIIRSDVVAIINDYKAIANKFIIKGEALIKILYSSDVENMQLETMEYSIPINQIVDVSAIDEECSCEVKLEVMNSEIDIRQDTSEENHLFDIDIKLCATVVGYKESEIALITDSYSTQYELQTSYKQTDIFKLLDSFTESYIDKTTIDFQERGISKIIDIWSELCSVNTKKENNKIIYNGKYNLCILGIDSDEEAFYTERMIDFKCEHEISNVDKVDNLDTDIYISSIGYHINGSNEIEIRADIKIFTSMYNVESYKAIVDVKADENSVKSKDPATTLTIYYADKGENIWDIARKYCTSVEAIKIENDLSDEVLDKRGMLLIPM